MIYYYDGFPRSGKSLHASMEIYKYLSEGKNVFANFNVDVDLVKPSGRNKIGNFFFITNSEWLNNAYKKINDRSIKTITEFSYINGLYNFARNFHKVQRYDKDGNPVYYPNQTLIVFDEWHELFNSRTWNAKDRLDWIDFFSHHGKLGYNIIGMSQADDATDKQLKGKIENEFEHRKLLNYVKFKPIVWLLRGLFRVEIFCVIERKYRMKSKKEGHMRFRFFLGRKKYYDFYNTSAIFSFNQKDGFVGVENAQKEQEEIQENEDKDTLWGQAVEETQKAEHRRAPRGG